jgi:hypothetical protein
MHLLRMRLRRSWSLYSCHISKLVCYHLQGSSAWSVPANRCYSSAYLLENMLNSSTYKFRFLLIARMISSPIWPAALGVCISLEEKEIDRFISAEHPAHRNSNKLHRNLGRAKTDNPSLRAKRLEPNSCVANMNPQSWQETPSVRKRFRI